MRIRWLSSIASIAVISGGLSIGCGGELPSEAFIVPIPGQAVSIPNSGAAIALTNPAFASVGGGGAIIGTVVPLALPANRTSFTMGLDAGTQLTAKAAAVVNAGGVIDAETYSIGITALIVYTEDPNNPTANPVVVAPTATPTAVVYTIGAGLNPSVLPLWHADEAVTRSVEADMVLQVMHVTPQ